MSKLRGLQRRVSTILSAAMLRRKGVEIGGGVQFDGFPIVSGTELGKLMIGDRCSLVSRSSGTALGVRSTVILRLLSGGARIQIGEDCGLSGTVICSALKVSIGNRCLIGADVMIFDTDFHNPEPEGRRYARVDWNRISAPIIVEDDVFIGARSIITKGVTIGSGSIVGAGSVVTNDIPPNTIAAGVPAKSIRGLLLDNRS